jgi:hypothetical protein
MNRFFIVTVLFAGVFLIPACSVRTTVKGVVLDAEGRPLTAAKITLSGGCSPIETQSDAEGRYQIATDCTPLDESLVLSVDKEKYTHFSKYIYPTENWTFSENIKVVLEEGR